LATSWAQRLKRVFNVHIETCCKCGDAVKAMPKTLALLARQTFASEAGQYQWILEKRVFILSMDSGKE